MDVGSTITDTIPIAGGAARAGGTDFERLKRGELLYSGVLRTNLAALLDRVVLDGARCSFVSGMYGEAVSKVSPACAVARLVEFG